MLRTTLRLSAVLLSVGLLGAAWTTKTDAATVRTCSNTVCWDPDTSVICVFEADSRCYWDECVFNCCDEPC